MICIYCGRNSSSQVCEKCLAEGNQILMYDEKCETMNMFYGIFNFFMFSSALFCLFSIFSSWYGLNFNYNQFSIITSLGLSFVSFVGTMTFYFLKNNCAQKINDRVTEVMKERHNIR